MKIANKTLWNTAELRRVFARVLTQWNKTDSRPVPSSRLKHITIVYSRRGYMSGHAYYNSGTMRLRLPKPDPLIYPTLNVRKVGFLFEHELAHCAGWAHKNMGGLNSWKLAGSSRYDYLSGLTVDLTEKSAKPKPDAQIVRYQRAVANLTRWKTKMKRAQTGIRSNQQKVKRYEKILAADGRLAAIKSRPG